MHEWCEIFKNEDGFKKNPKRNKNKTKQRKMSADLYLQNKTKSNLSQISSVSISRMSYS